MGQANWLILPIAALLPLILGFIYYHPKVLGTKLALMMDQPIEEITGKRSIGKTALIYLFSIMLAYALMVISVHQSAIFQLFLMDPELANSNSEYASFINNFMTKYGGRHRSFGHGVIHGAEASLIWGLAYLGMTTLMQGKPLKSIWIHLGFWVLCCGLMGGVICAFF